MKKTITFDLGIYSFHRIIQGSVCVDENKIQASAILGVLHPLTTVDASNIYAFAVHKDNGEVLQIVRKNLRFKRVVTLSCQFDNEHEIEVHVKLNAAFQYLHKLEAEQIKLVA